MILQDKKKIKIKCTTKIIKQDGKKSTKGQEEKNEGKQ